MHKDLHSAKMLANVIFLTSTLFPVGQIVHIKRPCEKLHSDLHKKLLMTNNSQHT